MQFIDLNGFESEDMLLPTSNAPAKGLRTEVTENPNLVPVAVHKPQGQRQIAISLGHGPFSHKGRFKRDCSVSHMVSW